MDRYQDRESAKDDYAHIRDLKDASRHDYSASWRRADRRHIAALKKDAHHDHESRLQFRDGIHNLFRK